MRTQKLHATRVGANGAANRGLCRGRASRRERIPDQRCWKPRASRWLLHPIFLHCTPPPPTTLLLVALESFMNNEITQANNNWRLFFLFPATRSFQKVGNRKGRQVSVLPSTGAGSQFTPQGLPEPGCLRTPEEVQACPPHPEASGL